MMGAEGGRVRESSAAVHGGLIDEGSHVSLEEGVDEDMEDDDFGSEDMDDVDDDDGHDEQR